LHLVLKTFDPFVHTSRILRSSRLTKDFADRLACEQQPEINPYQPSQTLLLFLQAGRQRGAPELLIDDALAAALERSIALLVLHRKLTQQLTESSLPLPALH
jgi:hypothetical protein